jgi:uncharacterized RDD family membrane protein YckC
MIDDQFLLTFSVVSALTMAIAYRPMLARLSLTLSAPYAKADVTKRLFAATIDAMLVITALVPYRSSESMVYLAAGAGYLIVRDAVLGRSVGKFICGLVVVNLETGLPCRWPSSVRRNLLFLLPGANVVAAFLEARTIVRDSQGHRLGDRVALTQVVEGFGAKDLLMAIQEWLLHSAARLDGNSADPERETA